MHHIQRRKLSAEAIDWLKKQTAAIMAAKDPQAEALRRWDNRRDNRFMDEVRQKLEAMAPGLKRCMYCEDSLGTDIEHFWPKAAYPGQTFCWKNYLLACSFCNSNEKRNLFPLDAKGAPLLLDPTADDPMEHLTLTPSMGRFRPHRGSPKGRASIDVFGLNSRHELVRGRRNAWEGLQALIIAYDRACQAQDHRKAQRRKQAIRKYPFSSVLVHLLRVSRSASASRSISSECLAVLEGFPEIYDWI